MDDEPLMEIFATPDEVGAVKDAIECYLDYVKRLPETTKEEQEAVILLERLQQRLDHSTVTII